MQVPERPVALRDVVSDPHRTHEVLQAIGRLSAAKLPADALDVLFAAKDKLGVEQAVFVSYMRDDVAHENYRFLLAADPTWCFEYQSRAWYASDPWLLYAAHYSDVVSATTIVAATSRQHEVLDLAKRYGMVSVCIAPAASPAPVRRVGALALGTRQEGFFDDEPSFAVFKVLAGGLAMRLHHWWHWHEREEIISSRRISHEDLELLKLEWSGCGTKKIVARLGLSEASVDSRWQRLNRKLGAPHRRAAASLAAEYGLI